MSHCDNCLRTEDEVEIHCMCEECLEDALRPSADARVEELEGLVRLAEELIRAYDDVSVTATLHVWNKRQAKSAYETARARVKLRGE